MLKDRVKVFGTDVAIIRPLGTHGSIFGQIKTYSCSYEGIIHQFSHYPVVTMPAKET